MNCLNYGKQTGVKAVEGNVLRTIDAEVGLETTAEVFAQKASVQITVDQSRQILKNMGIDIPARIGKDQMNQFLTNMPKLTENQIKTYYEEALKLAKPSISNVKPASEQD